MKFGFPLFILLLICSAGFSQAQTAQPENVAASDPFVGTVTYSIFWKGPNTALWARQIPDSMQLTVSDGDIRVQVFGGVADSLVNEYIWLHASGEFFLIDHRNETVYSHPQDMGPVTLDQQALPSQENALEILGYACDAFRFSGNGNADTYWLSPQLVLTDADLPDSIYQPPFIDPDMKLIPLRMERNVNGVQMISEATSIVEGAAAITLPPGYEKKPFFKHAARHPYFHKRFD